MEFLSKFDGCHLSRAIHLENVWPFYFNIKIFISIVFDVPLLLMLVVVVVLLLLSVFMICWDAFPTKWIMDERQNDLTPNWELDGKVADSIDHEMKMKCNFGMNPMPK